VILRLRYGTRREVRCFEGGGEIFCLVKATEMLREKRTGRLVLMFQCCRCCGRLTCVLSSDMGSTVRLSCLVSVQQLNG
jgi:hypothetical protein